MAHDVFISYSAKDKTAADAVCALLESEGIRCWIAPRDVLPGMEWGECIIEAIEQTRVMVLIFTADANGSPQIRREVERAVNHSVAILPFRIENVEPGRALEYFIGNVHWLDALTPPLEAHLKNLAGTIKMLLARMGPRNEPAPHLAEGVVHHETIAPEPPATPAWEPRHEAQPPQPAAPPYIDPHRPESHAAAEHPFTVEPAGFGRGVAPEAPPAQRPDQWPSGGGIVAAPRSSKIPRWALPGAVAFIVVVIAIVFAWLHYKSQKSQQQPVFTATNASALSTTNLNSIFGANDGHRLWLVGDAGTIMESDDDGKTWDGRGSSASRNLNWVAGTSDGKHLYAVGDSGTIVRSADSGKKWEMITTSTTNDLYSVFAADDAKRVWIVGASGTLLASTDGGSTWKSETSGTGMWLWAIRGTTNGTKLWAVGAWGTLIQSSDGGATWHAQVINSNENIHSFFATNDGQRLWAVGNDRNIWESTDGGSTWASKNSGKGEAFLTIYGAGGDAIWLLAAGTGGTMLRSDHDDGAWMQLSPGTAVNINSIFGSSDGTYLWAVGNNGTIIRSVDGGQNWTR